MNRTRQRLALAATLATSSMLPACPKPQPEPVPAGCKPPNHCAGEPHTEGPPPVGSTAPPKT